MVGDIAHELRTPLTTIRTWLETARDGDVELDAEVIDLLVEEAKSSCCTTSSTT